MPGSFQTSAVAAAGRSPMSTQTFESGNTPYVEYGFVLSGFTRDASGAVLPNCTVRAFRTTDDSLAAAGSSDANGYYIFPATPALAHYVVAYKAGSPDVAGSSINTLVGA